MPPGTQSLALAVKVTAHFLCTEGGSQGVRGPLISACSEQKGVHGGTCPGLHPMLTPKPCAGQGWGDAARNGLVWLQHQNYGTRMTARKPECGV